jgi:hypothetical protein
MSLNGRNTTIQDVLATYYKPEYKDAWTVNDKAVDPKKCMRIASRANWEILDDICTEDFEQLRKYETTTDISYFLTVCFNLAHDDKAFQDELIELCLPAKLIKIHNKLYRTQQLNIRDKNKRESKAAAPKGDYKNPNLKLEQRLGYITRWCNTKYEKKAHVCNLLNDSITDGAFDKDIYLLQLREYFPKVFVDSSILSSTQLLPDEILGNLSWEKMTQHWVQCEELFLKLKNYERENDARVSLNYLNTYLFVFLPVWYYYNDDCDIPFPIRLEMFRGAFFVSRPESLTLEKKYPPTFIDFMDVLFPGTTSKYTRLSLINRFFEVAAQRAEIFDVPGDMPKPFLSTDLPESKKGLGGSTKKRIPSIVFPVLLQISHALCDWNFKVNELFKSGSLTLKEFKQAFKRTEGKDRLSSFREMRIRYPQLPELPVIYLNGKPIDFDLVSPDLSTVRKNIPIKSVNNRSIPLIFLQPLVQIAVALETGLRHQTIQWLAIDFDKYINEQEIEDHELYDFCANTDKAKDSEWTPQVSGRVIKLLRRIRDFRDLIDYPSFEKDVYYELNKTSKWGAYKQLLASNRQTGAPHTDSTYTVTFKMLLLLTERVLRANGYTKVSLVKIKEKTGTEKNTKRLNLESEITPHSTRVTVVSEHLTYLPADYVGKHITGQKPSTVAYYNKPSDEQRKELRQRQIDNLNSAMKGDSPTLAFVDTYTDKSEFVSAFKTNPKTAIHDFGAVSIRVIDSAKTGIQIVIEAEEKKQKLNLGFSYTNICPFNFQCPKEVIKQGLYKRCCICPYSIQAIEHLPAIAAKKHELIEELDEIERIVDEQENISDEEMDDYQAQRVRISEDIGALEFSETMLNKVREKMKDSGSYRFIANNPKMLQEQIEKGTFPSKQEGAGYYLSRIEEAISHPFSTSAELDRATLDLRMRLLANTGNIREALTPVGSIGKAKAEVFSLVQTLKREHGLTNIDVIQLINANVEDIYSAKVPLILFSTLPNQLSKESAE